MASSEQSYFASRTSGLKAVFGTFTSSKSYSTRSDLIAPERSALRVGIVADHREQLHLVGHRVSSHLTFSWQSGLQFA